MKMFLQQRNRYPSFVRMKSECFRIEFVPILPTTPTASAAL